MGKPSCVICVTGSKKDRDKLGSPQAPRARMHAGTPGQWGLLEAPRAPWPGQALAALVLAVFGVESTPL